MKVLTDNQYYYQIADVIREQNGTSNTYKPQQMVSALKDLFYEEVEGVPPITYNGIGENLLDYRIDGASGGVGDLITDSTDENYNKYKVPVVISGKNLFDEIYPNIVINTVKYISFALTNGEYTLSSNTPNGGSASLFLLAGQVNSGASTQNNGVWLNNPQTVNVIDGFLTIGYRIYGNMNPEDYETILALGSTATDYEPYHEPTITNIYLNTPIEANESISLSDTNVNIPTIRGTNVLTVDTTVQPSNVYIKSRHESSYETAMREDYEEQLSDIESALQEV